jgi:hypothetical protein
MLHNEAEILQFIIRNKTGGNVVETEFYRNVKEIQTSKTSCGEYIETPRKH